MTPTPQTMLLAEHISLCRMLGLGGLTTAVEAELGQHPSPEEVRRHNRALAWALREHGAALEKVWPSIFGPDVQ
ncbi:MAG: hypothetical protein ABID84_03985 [Chloroflexota bacterium]